MQTYIRKGLRAQKEKNEEETYTIRDYIIQGGLGAGGT